MAEHTLLMPYLLELAHRRDFVSSDCYFAADDDSEYSEIHIDAMRVIAHLSQKVCLTKYSKKYIASEQQTRYKFQIPYSLLRFDDEKYKKNSLRFVDRLLNILCVNLSKSPVIDSKECKHWMLFYSLTTICALAANPNNHGILSKFVKHKSEENEVQKNIKYANLSDKISV